MTFNRRQIIAGAGALTMASIAPAAVRPRSKGAAAPRILDAIVLGAGIAGLNAAWLLEQQGMKVLTLEARQRVGGRVYTLLDQPGTPEMGFNSMAAGYGRGIDAAKRAGVELYDVGPRYMIDPRQQLVIGGQALTRDQWKVSPLNPLTGAYQGMMPWEVVFAAFARANPLQDWSQWASPASAPIDVSVAAFLKAQGLNDAAIKLVFDTAPHYGVDADKSAALSYEFSDGWQKSQGLAGKGSFAVRGGNQKLTDGMAKLLKGDLLLGKEVVAIASAGGVSTVTCRDGSRFQAKKVVCALPFSTLRKIRIEPGLTGLQAKAVRTLNYQPLAIAFLTVSEPYWQKDGLPSAMWTDGVLGQVLPQRYGATPAEVTGLCVYARGKLARRWDAMGKDAALAAIVGELERLRPASRGVVKAAHYHSWEQEQFSAGDWVYFQPGEITTLGEQMGKPAGAIHFCGEHVPTANRGIEGALESSERAALEILSA